MKLEAITWMGYEGKAKNKVRWLTLQDGGRLSTETSTRVFMKGGLMIATRMKNCDNQEVGIREQPLFGFGACRFGGSGDGTQMLVPSEAAKMIEAYARQSGYFVFGEDLLAGLDAYHRRPLRCFDAITE